ncbi:MAG: hypothetical protein JSV56_12325, partial [Methanomassiliicoccales archaeon]
IIKYLLFKEMIEWNNIQEIKEIGMFRKYDHLILKDGRKISLEFVPEVHIKDIIRVKNNIV